VAAVLVVGIVAVALLAGGSDGGGGDELREPVDATGEVFLEPVSTTIDNPFAPSVGADLPDVTPPATLASAASREFTGGTVGLYGGTLDNASCDKEKLVSFLAQDSAKAYVWAQTLGLPAGGIEVIRDYVATLTSVVLRADTRVTNHGYSLGRVTEIDAVLQAGTAVLVDKYGRPVVKCYCGNPLTPPRPYRTPTYTGTRWPSFTPTSVTVIVKNTVVINNFTLVDPRTGQAFSRPAGGNGSTDGPADSSSSSSSSTSTTTRPSSGGVNVDGTYQGTFPNLCGFDQAVGVTITVRRLGTSLSLNFAGPEGSADLPATMTSRYEFSGTGSYEGESFTVTGRFEPSAGGGMSISGTLTDPQCTTDFSGPRTG
jgi:hypothetical protein